MKTRFDVTPRSPYCPVHWSFEKHRQMIKILSNIYLTWYTYIPVYFQALNPDTVIISQFFSSYQSYLCVETEVLV